MSLSVFYPKGYVQVKKPLSASQKNSNRTRFGLFRPSSSEGFKLAIVIKTESSDATSSPSALDPNESSGTEKLLISFNF